MEAAQPLWGSSEDRQWQVASCQSASRADVLVLCVSACCSAAARSAAANAGLVWKLGYAAIGVRRPGAAACERLCICGCANAHVSKCSCWLRPLVDVMGECALVATPFCAAHLLWE